MTTESNNTIGNAVNAIQQTKARNWNQYLQLLWQELPWTDANTKQLAKVSEALDLDGDTVAIHSTVVLEVKAARKHLLAAKEMTVNLDSEVQIMTRTQEQQEILQQQIDKLQATQDELVGQHRTSRALIGEANTTIEQAQQQHPELFKVTIKPEV